MVSYDNVNCGNKRERERERETEMAFSTGRSGKILGEKIYKKPNDPDIICIYWIASVAQLV